MPRPSGRWPPSSPRLDQVRAAQRTLAAELAAAEHRYRAEITRRETETTESRDARAAAEARADDTLAAELDRVRAEAERTQAAELDVAEARHRTEIARLEAEAAESRDAATRDARAQADETLAAERNRARAEAELTTLAARLATAEERHHAEIARLETEAAESRDATTRDAQARADAQADDRLMAELDRARADAERTLADELAVAETRHGAEIARLEAEAAEQGDAATRDVQETAETQIADPRAAERERVPTDTEGTLADELTAAQARHYADIAGLETDSAENRVTAPRDAQAAAEALANDTLAAERDRVRADAVRTLATQLAAAEERHRTDIARLEAEAAEHRDAATRDAQLAAEALATERDRVRTDIERTMAAEVTRLETEAAESRANITRLETEARDTSEAATRGPGAGADRDRLPATAASTSISLRPLEPVHRGAGSHTTTDYYSLWRARSAAYAPPVEAAVARPSRVDPRRRRWALSVAATLLILLTNNPNSGSAPRQAPATVEAAGVSPAIGPTSVLDRDGALRAPIPGDTERHDPETPATGDEPETGVSNRAPLSTLVLEIMCVLVVMLLLRVTLFVGEGLVWHGLVVTLGLILLGSVVMRAPWGG